MRKLAIIIVIALFAMYVKAQNHLSLNTYSGQAKINAVKSVTLTDGFHVPFGNNLRIFVSGTDTAIKANLNIQPTASINHIIKTIYRRKGADVDDPNYMNTYDVVHNITYVDGLGRVLQEVKPMTSAGMKDVVQPKAYDEFGRQPKQYLPYTDGNDGSYKVDALTTGQGLFAFYSTPGQQHALTDQPYASVVYDKTPFNTVIEEGTIGAYGQPYNPSIPGSGRTKKLEYGTNQANEVSLWQINGGHIITTMDFPIGSLRKTVAKDANWVSGKAGTTETFTDLEGKLLLQRVYDTETTSQSTHYVYDLLGRLRYVLPPNVNLTNIAINGTEFNEKVYAYTYDYKGRVIEKKLPNIGVQLIVYNDFDLPVLTQDAMLRAEQKWFYIKYDHKGRVVSTGVYTTASSVSSLRATVAGNVTPWETRSASTTTGYTSNAFPVGDGEILSINYYDNYNLPNDCPFTVLPSNASLLGANELLTARKVKKLDENVFLWGTNYYNKDKLLIETWSQNQLNGYDKAQTTYNEAGVLLAVKRTHVANDLTTNIVERYGYDHVGRLKYTWHKVNEQPEILLSALNYNELGQLVKKQLHSIDMGESFLQEINYTYTANGQLRSINNANLSATGNQKFGMELAYEDAPVPQYNGNIGQGKWKVARTLSSSQLGYDYNYDKVGRISAAESMTEGVKDNNYSEYARYDKIGNITSLGRYALLNGSRQQIDSLSYQYGANKLLKVDEVGSSPHVAGFKDQTVPSINPDYEYNENGGIIKDINKEISNISYNILNQVNAVSMDNATLNYNYTADGVKLKRTLVQAGNTISSTYYVGNIQYSSIAQNLPQLDFIKTSEGRLVKAGNSFLYQYDLRDNLGNTRATIDADPIDANQRTARVVQETSYYPFGLTMPNPVLSYVSGTKNNYLYNGKELQDEIGLYDYMARMYDPATARWNGFDPMAEKYYNETPYSYVSNNPLRFIDPSGMTKIDPDPKNEWWNLIKDDGFFNVVIRPGGGDETYTGSKAVYSMVWGNNFMNAFQAGMNINIADYAKQQTLLAEMKTKYFEKIYKAYKGYADEVYASGGMKASPVAENGGWMGTFSKWNTSFGYGFTALDNTPGSFRLGTTTRWVSPKYYANAWAGNQYANTFNIGKIGKGLGYLGAGVGVVVDGIGMYNYYQNPNSPNSPNTVSPGKFSLNLGMTGLGFTGIGTIPAALYFGVDAFYPGGTSGFVKDYSENTVKLNNLCNCDQTAFFY